MMALPNCRVGAAHSLVSAASLSCGHCLTFTWVLSFGHVGAAPLSCGRCPTAVWALPRSHWALPHCRVGTVPLPCGSGLTSVWTMPHSHVCAAKLSCGRYLSFGRHRTVVWALPLEVNNGKLICYWSKWILLFIDHRFTLTNIIFNVQEMFKLLQTSRSRPRL